MVVLDTREVLARVGDIEIEQLKKRLKCSGCGGRPGDVVPRRDTADTRIGDRRR